MKNYKKQQGASTPMVVLFLGMAMIVLTIAFKLYPAYYEHWQLQNVISSFEDESDLGDLSVKEIERRFDSRLQVNNVRDFNSDENLTVLKQDGSLSIYVDYEVRIPIYDNIDAILTFEESLEKSL